ncbi:GNAT family N-acetyltransferase [Calidifontibacter terrae]
MTRSWSGSSSVTCAPTTCSPGTVAVLPEAHGRGLGCELLTTVESFAVDHGYARVFFSKDLPARV